MFEDARRLFKTPDVIPASELDLRWDRPDKEALVGFLCQEIGLEEKKILKICKNIFYF